MKSTTWYGRKGGAKFATTLLACHLLVASLYVRLGRAAVGGNLNGPAVSSPQAAPSQQTHLNTDNINRHDCDVDSNTQISSSGGSGSGGVKQGGMVDFSFSHVTPSCLPAPAELDSGDDMHYIALSLRECSLGDSGVSELAQSPWVYGDVAARALSLRHNQITATGARALFEALRSSSADRLLHLQLDFNPLGDAGAQPLPAYLKQRAARGGGGLEELSLRFCGIGPAGCRYLSSALAKSAASAAAGEIICREGRSDSYGERVPLNATRDPPNREGPSKDDARQTMPEVGTSPEQTMDGELSLAGPPVCGFRRLLLTGNRLGDSGARALASALAKDHSVELLDLSRCNIGDEGARCLAHALRTNTHLRELRLSNNEITGEGALSLAPLLSADGGALETLELAGNRIGDSGALALARGLAGAAGGGREHSHRRDKSSIFGQRKRGLQRLNLSGNGIGCVGGCALAKALRGSGGRVVLEELELAGNPLSLSAARAGEVAKKNASLYKSAGGALSSLLNQFVEESYYRPNTLHSTSGGVGERNGGPVLRCAIAAFGTALRDEACSLKVLGLARTGVTDSDVLMLAAALRERGADSPLEDVEVALNELSVEALKAVRLAIESPTVPGSGSETHEPHISAEGRWPKTRDRGDGRVRRGAGPPRSRGAVFGGRGEEDDEEERAAQSEVQKYTPLGGNVELELLGRKVASFHQATVAESSLNVQVFGKRVRFERPSTASGAYRMSSPRTGKAAFDDGSDEGSEWDHTDEQDSDSDGEAGGTDDSGSYAEEEKVEDDREMQNEADDDEDEFDDEIADREQQEEEGNGDDSDDDNENGEGKRGPRDSFSAGRTYMPLPGREGGASEL